MGITMAITELLSLGPEQWISQPPATADAARDPQAPLGLDAEEWDDVCCRIMLPALRELTGVAVASGAVGLWLHGHVSRHCTRELRLIGVRPDHATVWTRLASHAHGAGWDLERVSHANGYFVGPSSAVRVHLLQPALPDEAFDGPRGYQRATLADWALAVEALGMIATARETGAVDAALSHLRFLLEQVPDVLWTHALRSLTSTARASWLVVSNARSVPELREAADATPFEGMAS